MKDFTKARTDEEWSHDVLERADHTCMWPGCNSKWNVTPHHIIDRRHSATRLVLENGIALCGEHHRRIQTAPAPARERMSEILIGRNKYRKLKEIADGSGH